MDMQVQDKTDATRPLAGQGGGRHRIDQRHRPRHRPRARRRPAPTSSSTASASQREIEFVCDELEKRLPVSRVVYNGANLMDGRRGARPGRGDDRRVRPASTSSSTMPASSTSARSRASRPRNMTRSSRSTCRPPGTPSRAAFAAMKDAGLRPDHQRRLGPRPRRLAVQERLRRRQARRASA